MLLDSYRRNMPRPISKVPTIMSIIGGVCIPREWLWVQPIFARREDVWLYFSIGTMCLMSLSRTWVDHGWNTMVDLCSLPTLRRLRGREVAMSLTTFIWTSVSEREPSLLLRKLYGIRSDRLVNSQYSFLVSWH